MIYSKNLIAIGRIQREKCEMLISLSRKWPTLAYFCSIPPDSSMLASQPPPHGDGLRVYTLQRIYIVHPRAGR
jgi:hypothetical protein